MKKKWTFDLIGFDSLSNLLKSGISGYSVVVSKAKRPASIELFLNDATFLRIQSKIIPAGSWHEVGTLIFELKKLEKSPHEPVPLPPAWQKIKSVEMLYLEEENFLAECGLAIHTCTGEHSLIVPGAFPFTVEIEAPFYESNFEPEYDVNVYQRKNVYEKSGLEK